MMAGGNNDALRRDVSSEKIRTDEFACHSVVDLGPSVAAKALCSTRHDEATTTSDLARSNLTETSMLSYRLVMPDIHQ